MAESESSVPMSDFTFLRDEIRHEDNLINQRVSWLIGSQSFLLTGVAIALNAPIQLKDPSYERMNLAIIFLIPLVGVLVCLASYASILAGVIHMRRVRRLAGTCHPPHLPGVQGTILTRWLGLSGPVLVPVVFLAVWLVLLIHR